MTFVACGPGGERAELERDGVPVAVTSVHPGGVRTDIADAAMYRAKQAGRGTWRTHGDARDESLPPGPPGWSNSLGQKLVQLTMPGVPDVYQGSELWEQSLVDPDNRRPVDHALRARLLATLEPQVLAQIDAVLGEHVERDAGLTEANAPKRRPS